MGTVRVFWCNLPCVLTNRDQGPCEPVDSALDRAITPFFGSARQINLVGNSGPDAEFVEPCLALSSGFGPFASGVV